MTVGRFLKAAIQTALLITCFFVVSGLKTSTQSPGLGNAVAYFKASASTFSSSTQALKASIVQLRAGDTSSIIQARRCLKNSRIAYKRLEFFLNYFFESSSLIYNKPAKVEVEEPYMEYQEPSGFQVVEALLFDADPHGNKERLLEQAELLQSSAADLNSLLYGFEANDQQLLESLRLELVRIISLSITGYDAPELKSGITEACQSMQTIALILDPYLPKQELVKKAVSEGPKIAQAMGKTVLHSALKKNPSLRERLNTSIKYLQEHQDFDSFDRMEFLTSYALPLQEALRDFIQFQHAELNDKSALNYQAKNLFSREALLPETFLGNSSTDSTVKEAIGSSSAAARNKERIALGKTLFFEKALSGNLKRTCASCHEPQRYFTDGVKASLAFDGIKNVERNAPTLLYAGYQYSQFWDGRAKNLPEQIKAVIANPFEMNGDHQVIIKQLSSNKTYLAAFDNVYGAQMSGQSNPLTMENLSDAIAAYVMDLAPMNSPFDRYIAGDKSALSKAEIKGFNLFMGKGQCGSCHFAPLFNGLIPPLYKLTEYENLGTPANDDFSKLQKDADKGRYGFFPISYYEAAFKTPTVRNVAKTAPYMHNGVFRDLEKVVEFYNQGGGAGLKMDQPGQTLSSKPLHLTDEEVRQIVVFMQSLTDQMN